MTGRRARRPEDYWTELAREGVPVDPLRDDAGPVTSSAGGGVDVAVPTRTDPLVRAASTVVGGPAGRRLAIGTGTWRVLPVLLLLATAMLGLGAVQKQHCRVEGWTTPDQFWHACYSDIPVLYGSAGLGDATRPGLTTALAPDGLDTPPLTGAAMWVVSAFVPQGDGSARQYFDLSAVLLLGALLVAVAALVAVARHRGRPWDAAHLALSPLLLTAALVSYQLLAVMLLVLAVHAWTRERNVWAGVLLGAAVASAPVVWLLVPLIALIAVRSGRSAVAANVAGWALVTWFLLRVALLPGLFGGLTAGWRDWSSAAPGYGSLWLVPQLLADSEPGTVTSPAGRVLHGLFAWVFNGAGITSTTYSVLTVVLGVIVLGAVVWFGFGGGADLGRRPDLSVDPQDALRMFAPLALAVLSVGLITARSLPVQASLLLLPLIALAGLPWRDHLVWAATEVVYFVGVWLYIAADSTPDRGLPAFVYLILLIARLAGIGYLGVRGVLAARAISLRRVPAVSL